MSELKQTRALRAESNSIAPVPAFTEGREGRLVPDLRQLLAAIEAGSCGLTRQGEPSRTDTRRIVSRLQSAPQGSHYAEFLVFLAIQLDLVERTDGRLTLRSAYTDLYCDPERPLAAMFEAWCRSPFWSERYPRRRIAWCGDQMAFAFYREPLPRYREVALGALRGVPIEVWVPFDEVLRVARSLGFFEDVRWGYREAFGNWDGEADGPHVILSRFLQEALLWLGVVRVGREAPASPRFSVYVTAEGAMLMGHPRGPRSLGAALGPGENSRHAG